MNIFTSALKATLMTKWFLVASWQYVVTKRTASKIEFVAGVVPAWWRFMAATYSDCRRSANWQS